MSRKAFDKMLIEALAIAHGSSAYNIRLTQLSPEDDGVYLAWVPDLPGCISDGNTPEEAYTNAIDAIENWISEAIRLGRVVPMPGRKWAAS